VISIRRLWNEFSSVFLSRASSRKRRN